MFINLTNHPSAGWSKVQQEAAQQYGEIVDMPFPAIDELGTEEDILQLAEQYALDIAEKGVPGEITVHIMGEQTFCYALISKLQEKGIRCVASCTERDTYVNEEGQTVHSFHFSKFREYAPPRITFFKKIVLGLNKITNSLSSKWNFLKNKNFFSTTALVFTLLFELAVVAYLQLEWPCLETWAYVLAGIVLFLFVTGRLCKHQLNLRRTIVTKLLANAVTPSRLGTFYLLAFAIHIGWLTNAVLGLFTASGDDFCRVFTATVVCILGILSLIVFFPNGKTKSQKTKNIVISGLSRIQATCEYQCSNIRPFVRIFQKVKANVIKVVLSDDLVKSGYTSPKVYVQEKNENRFSGFMEDKVKLKPTDAEKTKVFSKILGNITTKTTDINQIKEDLRTVIKEAARLEFYDDKEALAAIDACKIEFTDFLADYNDYQHSFTQVNELAKSLDTQDARLFFNLTPGTVTLSSVMTLIAIDGDRSLYYYSQDTNQPDSLKVQEVIKNDIPLENLLSQALENVSKGD